MKKILLLVGSLALTATVALSFSDTSHAVNQGQLMQRLYNHNTGEHFYTKSIEERNYLMSAGWWTEGIGWTAPDSGDEVYRLYNANAADHHYTLNASERDSLVKAGWKYEGVGWYSDTNQGEAVYRAYNPNAISGSHNYTVSLAEQNNLINAGWHNENIGWYGLKVDNSEPSSYQYKDGKQLAAKVVIKTVQDNNGNINNYLNNVWEFSFDQNIPLEIWYTGVYLPQNVTVVSASPLAGGTFVYHNNGDGTVTVYPVPTHFQDLDWDDPVKGKQMANEIINKAYVIDIRGVSDNLANRVATLMD